MKKLIPLLFLILLCACAFAEEDMIVYDPAVFEVLGLETQTLALEDFGMVFDLPADMLELELTEADLAGGTIAAFAAPDLSRVMSVGFAQMVDPGGNPLEDYEALISYYQMFGASDLEILDVNGLYALTYAIADADIMGSIYLFDDSYALAFTFAPLSDEGFVPVAASIMTSIRPTV